MKYFCSFTIWSFQKKRISLYSLHYIFICICIYYIYTYIRECPRSLAQFYMVSILCKLDKASWTYKFMDISYIYRNKKLFTQKLKTQSITEIYVRKDGLNHSTKPPRVVHKKIVSRARRALLALKTVIKRR